MEEKILNEILKDTFTLEALRKRVQVLKLILEREIYRPNTGEVQKSDIEISQTEWLSKFDKELITGMTSQMYSSLSERIEKFIEGVVPLTIYFVFIPDEDMLKKIGGWLRENLEQPRLVFDLKVMTLISIFAYAFFRFSWSMRQYTFVALVIGSMPHADEFESGKHNRAHFAKRASRMLGLAAETFNDGLRAYYFAFAVIAWFFSPVALFIATIMVILILYSREYRSDVLSVLND